MATRKTHKCITSPVNNLDFVLFTLTTENKRFIDEYPQIRSSFICKQINIAVLIGLLPSTNPVKISQKPNRTIINYTSPSLPHISRIRFQSFDKQLVIAKFLSKWWSKWFATIDWARKCVSNAIMTIPSAIWRSWSRLKLVPKPRKSSWRSGVSMRRRSHSPTRSHFYSKNLL